MKARFLTVLLATGLATLPALSQAKSLSRIIAEMGLSPADFETLSAASNNLLSGGTPAVGNETSWVNEDTGSQGTIRVFEFQDNCVGLQHVIQPDGQGQNREIRTRRCQDGGGNWVLTP